MYSGPAVPLNGELVLMPRTFESKGHAMNIEGCERMNM
jgi:hypothetical protein